MNFFLSLRAKRSNLGGREEIASSPSAPRNDMGMGQEKNGDI
ncbi:MAG: hypothetical protein AAGB97_01970 [Dehalococcoidia bacterium]|nr:hypothetical protein [Chloroflexota bacterium]